MGVVPAASEEAYQPNGIDLTVESIEMFDGDAYLGALHKKLARTFEVEPDAFDCWHLDTGPYLIRLTEEIQLPNDTMAYLLPRSSLLRMGATLETAVWDAGYCGRGQCLLVVHNPYGLTLEKGARIGQMVFHRLEQATGQGYAGAYQNEGIRPGPYGWEVTATATTIPHDWTQNVPSRQHWSFPRPTSVYERADVEDSFRPILDTTKDSKPHDPLRLRDDFTDLDRIDAAFARMNPLE